jgi:hypothetical protein
LRSNEGGRCLWISILVGLKTRATTIAATMLEERNQDVSRTKAVEAPHPILSNETRATRVRCSLVISISRAA